MSSIEYCCNCEEPTGRAGIAEDSLYVSAGDGPFCETCWEELLPNRTLWLGESRKTIKELEAENARLRKLLKWAEDANVDFFAFDEILPQYQFTHENPSEECDLIERIEFVVRDLTDARAELAALRAVALTEDDRQRLRQISEGAARYGWLLSAKHLSEIANRGEVFARLAALLY